MRCARERPGEIVAREAARRCIGTAPLLGTTVATATSSAAAAWRKERGAIGEVLVWSLVGCSWVCGPPGCAHDKLHLDAN